MYLTNIGLEVHVQLLTRSKMFCACPVEFGAPPNAHTCPTCLGLPGGLPVMNREALILTVLTGCMLGCDIAAVSRFDRKNYFYPDVAKNYQITQYEEPLCTGGSVSLHRLAYPKDAQKSVAPAGKQIGLVRIHLEEDVARSFHFEASTGIDFNRAGTPLMEIVTRPDISSPEEAFAFLTALRQTLFHGRVSTADMEKGQLRCDCNVSLRPHDQEELGAKIEIKNLNSISGVRRALAYEVERQTAALIRGENLEQETRGWDDDTGATFSMRTKEEAHDYRYFPDPDLLPVKTESIMAEARRRMPELPGERRARLEREFQITAYDAAVLTDDPALAEYFEKAVRNSSRAKGIANWIINDLQHALLAADRSISDCPISPVALDELVGLIEKGKISSTQGKEVFAEMFITGKVATAIVREKSIEQLSDRGAVEEFCHRAIAANPKAVANFHAGNLASLNFLKGQVMKLSQGKANPQVAGEILERKLRSAMA
ncbi:MAG: Asp-tRNA(Asn)/Glu-tRNA(Gln) amidotransferase subunit GatB [Verrucomicrobiota bacterium]